MSVMVSNVAGLRVEAGGPAAVRASGRFKQGQAGNLEDHVQMRTV